LASPDTTAPTSSRGDAGPEDGLGHLGPDGLHAEQEQEQVALGFRGEAVERERVLADREVGVQGDRAARAGTCLSVSAETLRR
jgi:hypothetical protein